MEVRGEWFRCVNLRRDPLSTEGARFFGGRLNCAGEPALYLASTPTLAVAKNLQLAGMFGVRRFLPRLLVTIEVTLRRVVDLRSDEVLAEFGLAADQLLGAWRGHGNAPNPTQLIGRNLASMGYEGAILPSAIEPCSANLAIFVQNIDFAETVHIVGD